MAMSQDVMPGAGKDLSEILDGSNFPFVLVGKKRIRQEVYEKAKPLFACHDTLIKEHAAVVESFAAEREERKKIALHLDESQKMLSKVAAEKKCVDEKYVLVSQLLAAPPAKCEALDAFHGLLHRDYVDFANKEVTLAEEAAVLLDFLDIERMLVRLANHPMLVQKHVVAIGGGFSSGKSTFINSFFSTDLVTLPTGIRPVTAIPAYVVKSQECQVKAHSASGGSIDLDSTLYSKLSHEFINQFSFNLKKILPFVTVSCPMEDGLDHVCFIDTPGFNAVSCEGLSTSDDFMVARDYMNQADALIWVVGLDVNGTFDRQSLDFLATLCQESSKARKLYILCNKCELKSDSEKNAIIDELERCLDDYGIDYLGISAYSAKKKKEFFFRKKSFNGFLEEMGTPKNEEYQDIINRIESNFDRYSLSINDKIKELKSIRKSLKALELDYTEVMSSINSVITEQTEHIDHLSRMKKKAHKKDKPVAIKSGIFWWKKEVPVEDKEEVEEDKPDYERKDVDFASFDEVFFKRLSAVSKHFELGSHEQNLIMLEKIKSEMKAAVNDVFSYIQSCESLQ